ncbi:MAG: hypothetical protein KC457_23345 [Myxococcales bacterium]|nr:hypothetical protein [Myxococcales bacterium]
MAGSVSDDLLCVPVSQVPSDAAPAERRGLARGPGIRPGTGGEITDWMFSKVYDGEGTVTEGESAGPFATAGVVAVGITTAAEGIYVLIDQPRVISGQSQVTDMTGVPTGFDPQHVMDVRLFPHSQLLDPNFDSIDGLPNVQDERTSRVAPADSDPSRYLAPSLRLIDQAYISEDHAALSLNMTEDLDQLGTPFFEVDTELLPLYDQKVPKVFVHDYRSWAASTWTMEWEGTLVSSSSTGRIDCKSPGWQGGTCLVANPDDARLLDDSATFCEDGVLPGDKLVLIGCQEDDDCGDGRRCLRESAGGGESSGICISAQAYEESAAELRQICHNFISDPCGEAYREFTITKAFQDELWIQAMDQRSQSFIEVDESGETPVLTAEVQGQFICADDQPSDGCFTHQDCNDFFTEIGGEDPEQWLCIENRCRRPCEDADECVLRRLPGPTCFGEFVRYQVALRNAFRITGPINFNNALIEVDPDTGECRETTDPEISRLLTGRLPIPASDDPDDPEWQAIPVCPYDNTQIDVVEASYPNPCRIVAGRSLSNPYHNLVYEGQTVSALRFSNPIFSVIVDLTSIDSLTAAIAGYENDELYWPAESARFDRSRIPRGYRESFRLDTGYQPFAEYLSIEGRLSTYPVRIIAAPEARTAYIVDGSGPGSASSVRGQVLRVTLANTISADQAFNGVR